MRLLIASVAALVLSHVPKVLGVDPTDTLMDGDSAQSGYLPNHNMDPAIVSGGNFGQIWKFQTPPPANGQPEQFFAKPLIYTPSRTGRQIVFGISEQNKMYILDAVNGTLYASRDLSLEGERPFLTSDLGCNDITGTIGVTGTPVIDPTTDTIYFWAKSYLGSAIGYQNGAYRFHAVDAVTLAERPGFPTNIQGQPADNDATRVFTGGTVLQRASLNLINGVVFAGFGGHCDQYNFTGWVVGMSTAGKYVTGYVTSGGPGAPPQDGTFNGGGGGSGIWMSGAAIASDNAGRLFFATGNGFKTDVNQQQPASGRVHLDTLSECMVNMAINKNTGKLTQQDYFEPYEYLAMDAGDRDLGSGGVCLPDPSVFSGAGVNRLAITCGKNAKCYITNADNLGGYKLGASGGDLIVQTLTPPSGGSIFGNVGTYPLEGGYLYVTPVGSPTYVYKLGFSTSGTPQFTLVAQTDDSATGRVGTGPATLTSFKGQDGTGILWVADPDAGIRAYHAVPVNGKMIKISIPSTPNVSKFQRPAFGNGRYYVSSSNGNILAFGSPVALPLTCTSPIDFGNVAIGSQKTLSVTCTAKIAITKINGLVLGNSLYQAKNSSLPTGSLAVGASFSFPVTFNLTAYQLNAGSTSAPVVSPGVQTTSLSILTTNGVTGYATDLPLTLTGKSVSEAPFIQTNPLEVDFSGIVVGTAAAQAGSASNFVISNVGQRDMHIIGYAFTKGAIAPDGDEDPAVFTNVTFETDGSAYFDENNYFLADNLPPIGSAIPGSGSVTVSVLFNTTILGDFHTLLQVYTDGGNAYTVFTGSASTVPIALLEYSTKEGGWITIQDCPIPLDGCSSTIDFGTSQGAAQQIIQLRFTNNGGSALIITKSKPLEGTVLGASNPNTDLSEGLAITPGDSESGSVFFSPGVPILNSPPTTYSGEWTLNTNDLAFGVHTVKFTGVLAARQVGPLRSNGSSLYQYLGCYRDNVNNVRLEPKQYISSSNTNGYCQNQALAFGAIFAGTEYMTECWVGSQIPNKSYKVDDSLCAYLCAGDSSQTCGGNGGYQSIYYDSSRYFPSNGTIIGGVAAPAVVPVVGSYQYSGCYNDSAVARVLTGITRNVQTNTLESCATFCKSYKYFGTEYGSECYCGDTLSPTSKQFPNSDCYMTCAGNASEFCGAAGRLTLYNFNGTIVTPTSSSAPSSAPTKPAGPSNLPVVGSYSFVECHTDAVASRTLTGKAKVLSALTIELCAATCAGYKYFGTEYSTECYCGNSLLASSTAATDGRCSMTCGGNSTELCGGQNGLSLYQLTNVTATSSSTSSASTFSTVLSVSSASSKLSTTLTSSVSSTSLASSKSSTSLVSSTSSSSSKSATSPSKSSASSVSSASSAPASTSSTSIISISATTSSAVPSATSAFSYMNCYSDNDVVNRALVGSYFQSTTNMTVELCAATCSTYLYFGLEYAQECYCANTIAPTSTVVTDGRCSMPCTGNRSEICGGNYGLSLYKVNKSPTSTSTSTPSPTGPIIPPTIGNYSYLECHSDNTTIRTLSSKIRIAADMTLESCATTCIGYTYWGVEYATECYCANTLSYGSFVATDGRCNMKCGGNSTEICGGSNGLTLYKLSSTLKSSSTSVSSVISFTQSSISSSSGTSLTFSKFTNSSSTSIPITSSSSSSTFSSSSVEPSTTESSSSITTSRAESSSLITSTSESSVTSTSTSTLESSSSVIDSTSTSSSTVTSSTSSSSSSSDVSALESTSTSATSTLVSFSSSVTSSAESSASVSSTAPSTSESSSSSVTTTSEFSSSVASSTSDYTSESSSSVVSSSSVAASTSGSSSSTSSTFSVPVSSTLTTITTSTSSRASSSSSSLPTASPWIYAGCANDTQTRRALSGGSTTSNSMTVELCQNFCTSKNFPLAGLEFGRECYCGSSLGRFSTLGRTGCNKSCSGSASEICGGASLLSVYNNTDFVAPRIVPSIAPYNFLACYKELTNSRAITGYSFTNATAMTAELCVGTCSARGYSVAGVEFGKECYCGNKVSTAAVVAAQADCTALLCPGNNKEFCGGSSRIAVYQS